MTHIWPAVLCPECSRTMKPHCPASKRCSWRFCIFCSITKDAATGKYIGLIGENE